MLFDPSSGSSATAIGAPGRNANTSGNSSETMPATGA